MPETPQQRTIDQNSALHLYFAHLAEELNDAGLDIRKVLKPEIDIPWTPLLIKEHLWRNLQKVILKKDSTTELTTKDIDKVYEVLNRFLSEKHGLHVPFPSIETLNDNQYGKKT